MHLLRHTEAYCQADKYSADEKSKFSQLIEWLLQIAKKKNRAIWFQVLVAAAPSPKMQKQILAKLEKNFHLNLTEFVL